MPYIRSLYVGLQNRLLTQLSGPEKDFLRLINESEQRARAVAQLQLAA